MLITFIEMKDSDRRNVLSDSIQMAYHQKVKIPSCKLVLLTIHRKDYEEPIDSFKSAVSYKLISSIQVPKQFLVKNMSKLIKKVGRKRND